MTGAVPNLPSDSFAKKMIAIINSLKLVAVVATIILVTASASIGSEGDGLPRGEVIEKVTCKADPQQSYSLFLPSRYDREKKWPILYAFDPGARGKLPVNLFKEAAEKFGFTVAGSNNSRNGIQAGPLRMASQIRLKLSRTKTLRRYEMNPRTKGFWRSSKRVNDFKQEQR